MCSLVGIIDLVGLPGLGSDVEGKGVNAVVVGKFDIFQPGVGGVRVGVAHHKVGSHNLWVAVSLGSWRKGQEMVRGRNFKLERLR